MQNILSWLDWRRSSDQKKLEELKHLQTLVNYIFEQFFGQEDAANKPLSEEVVKKQKETLDLFEKSIVEGLNIGHHTAATSLQAIFHTKRYRNHKQCELFIKQLESLFKYDPESNPQKVPSISVTFDMKIIAVIVYALQMTVIGIPKIMYSGTEQVPDDVKDRLTSILKYIDSIGFRYKLQATLLNRSDAINRLSLEIAQVEGYFLFPLKRLPTASLTQDDLKDFYVKRQIVDDENSLASSIINNDGIILVAGYRGVGKSTFINAALVELLKIEQRQRDSLQRMVVPVSINAAKFAGDAGALNILRLCIRALYEAFLGAGTSHLHGDLEKLLDEYEKYLLRWAHVRASYKVDVSQGESVSSLRNLEVSLNLKPGDLIPKPISWGIGGNLLPGFSWKYGKEWKRQVQQTIALLDYDADRAEEDIISIIEQFYKPGISRKVGIKLAFIFDEMDKLDLKEVETLIKQLKNFFLTRNTVFLFVTGIEVYDKQLQGRKDEDSLFGSYFSSIITVPLFKSGETHELLKKLWYKDRTSLSMREESYIQTLACYLNYHARGVPREIMRELQNFRKWEKYNLQSYVTFSVNWLDQLKVYVALQKFIEGMVSDVSNKQWQEKIERGLYVLIEEFLDQRNVVLDIEEFLGQKNASSEQQPFQVIRKNNFKYVPDKDLREVIKSLQFRLPRVLITDANNPDVKKKILFWLPSTPTTEGNVLVMTVNDDFYRLTGHSTSTSTLELEREAVKLSFDDINSYLKQQQIRFRWEQAFIALRLKQGRGEAFDEAIYDQLYRIFVDVKIPDEYSAFRPDAAQYLTSDAFFEHAKVQIPQQFIDQETDKQLLRNFIQLVQQGSLQDNTDEKAKRRDRGQQMLLSLLNRQKSAPESKGSSQRLPKSILIDLISALSLVTGEDILEQVVESLDSRKDLSDVLPALQRLEHNSRKRLIEVLLDLDFQAISSTTLLSILSIEMSQDPNKLNDLWSLTLNQKQKKLAQQIMLAILQQWSSTNTGQEAILQWVEGADWNASVDKPLLREAVEQNRVYFSSLSKSTPLSSPASVANSSERRLTEVLNETEPPPPPVKPELQGLVDTLKGIPFGRRLPTSTESSSISGSLSVNNEAIQETRQSAPGSVLRGWLIALAMLGILAVYFAVPFDLPTNTTLAHQLMARFLEAIYVYAGVLGIISLFLGIIIDDDRGFWIGVSVGLLVTAVVCFFLQIRFFPLVFTFLGQLILLGLLGAFWLPLLALRLPSKSTGASG